MYVWMTDWMNDWMTNEWMKEGMNEWMNEWRKEWMNEWMKEVIYIYMYMYYTYVSILYIYMYLYLTIHIHTFIGLQPTYHLAYLKDCSIWTASVMKTCERLDSSVEGMSKKAVSGQTAFISRCPFWLVHDCPNYQKSHWGLCMYGWWKKSCTGWYGKYPLIYEKFYTSQVVVWDFWTINSMTPKFHEQQIPTI